MAIQVRTIQMRRGLAVDFNPNKMLPGEWAVSQDNEKLYMCFTAGRVVEIGTTASIIHYIEDAEAWAIGTRSGQPVDNTQPQYHNNSKYYSEQGGASATAAANSATDSANSATYSNNRALDSEAWAVGERDGEPVEDTDETYENNSKYYSEQSGHYWDLVHDAVTIGLPTIAIDFVTGHLDISGSYLDFNIDNNGHLNWMIVA